MIYIYLFILMNPRELTFTLFPYTTLFRSVNSAGSRKRIWGERLGARASGQDRRNRGQAGPRHRLALCALGPRSEEHTSELQSPDHLVCRPLLEKNKIHPAMNLSMKMITTR